MHQVYENDIQLHELNNKHKKINLSDGIISQFLKNCQKLENITGNKYQIAVFQHGYFEHTLVNNFEDLESYTIYNCHPTYKILEGEYDNFENIKTIIRKQKIKFAKNFKLENNIFNWQCPACDEFDENTEHNHICQSCKKKFESDFDYLKIDLISGKIYIMPCDYGGKTVGFIKIN